MDDRIRQVVKSYVDQHWKNIEQRILHLLHPHHIAHEAGGTDQVLIPVEFLSNVKINEPKADSDVLTWVEDDEMWENKVGGGGGIHEAYLGFPLPTAQILPGPKNISGADEHILACDVISDGLVQGSCDGYGAFDAAIVGGYTKTGLDITWTAGTRLTLTITDQADASYIAITWAVSN